MLHNLKLNSWFRQYGIAISIMLVLSIITATCSYFLLGFVPYLVSVLVVLVIILVCFKRIPEKHFPIYLVGLSLSMILQQTMLGSYIVGTDIHQEFYTINRTIENGWDWSYYSLNNTSIVLNVIAPFLYKIGIPVLWQLKLLFPIVLSFVPLILYIAFSKQIGKRYGFYSTIFFIIVPVFTVEIATITKSMVAELFFALIILVLFTQMRFLKKFLLLSFLGVLTVMCHYTIGTLVFGYLGITGIILLLCAIFTRKFNFVPVIASVLVIGLVGGLWFYYSGGGIVYIGYTNSYNNITKKISEINITSSSPSTVSLTTTNVPKNAEEKPKENYLDRQDYLIRTALGMDWNKTDISGKLFRIIQYVTQLAIIFGALVLLFNYKKYKVSICFTVGILASVIILGGVLFIPKVASIINTTRWYHSALFFASPLLVIGLSKIGKEWLVAGVLIIYYVFTSGLVYTITRSDVPSLVLSTPYSVAYDWNQGLIGIFNKDDIVCAKWMKNNMGKEQCHTGFTDTYLFLGYVEFNGQFTEIAPDEPHYLFISSQNSKLGKMTTWTEPAMRRLVDIPSVNKMKEVFRQGNSVIYFGESDKK